MYNVVSTSATKKLFGTLEVRRTRARPVVASVDAGQDAVAVVVSKPGVASAQQLLSVIRYVLTKISGITENPEKKSEKSYNFQNTLTFLFLGVVRSYFQTRPAMSENNYECTTPKSKTVRVL